MVVVTGVLKEEILGVFRELLPLLENGELLRRHYSRGIIGGNEVVALFGFIGKVESAMMAQLLIDRFRPTHFIHCGSAGAISPELRIGEVVCGNEYFEHDFQRGSALRLPASVKIIEKLTDVYPNLRIGPIVSGDVLVSERVLKERLHQSFGAFAVDMDSAALAKVCYENGVEFCAVKVIVDTSEEQALMEYEQNFRKFASLPSTIVSEMLEKHLL